MCTRTSLKAKGYQPLIFQWLNLRERTVITLKPQNIVVKGNQSFVNLRNHTFSPVKVGVWRWFSCLYSCFKWNDKAPNIVHNSNILRILGRIEPLHGFMVRFRAKAIGLEAVKLGMMGWGGKNLAISAATSWSAKLDWWSSVSIRRTMIVVFLKISL